MRLMSTRANVYAQPCHVANMLKRLMGCDLGLCRARPKPQRFANKMQDFAQFRINQSIDSHPCG